MPPYSTQRGGGLWRGREGVENVRVRCKDGVLISASFVMGNHYFSLNMFRFERFVRENKQTPMRSDVSG